MDELESTLVRSKISVPFRDYTAVRFYSFGDDVADVSIRTRAAAYHLIFRNWEVSGALMERSSSAPGSDRQSPQNKGPMKPRKTTVKEMAPTPRQRDEFGHECGGRRDRLKWTASRALK